MVGTPDDGFAAHCSRRLSAFLRPNSLAVLLPFAVGLLMLSACSSRNEDVPVVKVAPVSLADVAQFPREAELGTYALAGFAVRALPDEPDVYLAQVVSGNQRGDVAETRFLRGDRSKVKGSFVEPLLDSYPLLVSGDPDRRMALPIIRVHARTGQVFAATETQWEAAPRPTTFSGLPSSDEFVRRLSESQGWEHPNVGIGRAPLPRLATDSYALFAMSLDTQFVAVTLGEQMRRGLVGPARVATGQPFVSFIDTASVQRLDPSFELVGAPSPVNLISATWTPDNCYLLCVDFGPDGFWLWIVPFEHGRQRPVGSWDHIRLMDHPAWVRDADGKRIDYYRPRSQDELRPVSVPEAWRSPQPVP